MIAAVCAALAQPPAIGKNGVVNSASFIPTALAGREIARGARFLIRGVRLGTSRETTAVHAGSLRVPLLSVNPKQVEALMPANAPLGEASLVVTVDGQSSAPFRMRIARAGFGIYSLNRQGWGPAQATPLKPGQAASITGTGLGGLTPVVETGGQRARVLAIRKLRDGDEEIRFTVPGSAPEGCYVPILVRLPDRPPSNVVTLPIRSSGGPCEAAWYFPFPHWTGRRSAVVALSRTVRHEGPEESIVDEATASFVTPEPGGEFPGPMLLVPPVGACTTYAGGHERGDEFSSSLVSSLVASLSGAPLDAGPHIAVAGNGILRRIPHVTGARGLYRSKLGDSHDPRSLAPYFSAGMYQVAGYGGSDVGSFALSLPAPAPFSWIGRDELAAIDRRRPLTVKWQGAGADRVMSIVAVNTNLESGAIGVCHCLAPFAQGHFAIPAGMLSHLPATGRETPQGWLFLASWPLQLARIRAKGLEEGVALSAFAQVLSVRYN